MRKLLLGLIGLLFAVPAVATDLPAGYTELEYIQGDKSAYLKSGIILDNDSGVEAKFQFPNTESASSGNFICGARNSGPTRAFALVGFSGGSYWASNYNNSGETFGHADTNIHIIKRDKEKVYFDGSLVLTSASATFTTPGEAYVFSINQGGTPFLTSNIKLWYLKMWDNGTLVRDFVPAKRNSDNVVGMYDTVSGNFFTNAGTGEFIAGPVVEIRIATTAYNSARFSPVVTELNDTIATIRSVVTNTINQTKAIADLQATKQTRPNENCPAGKKCLLVEDNDGQPHWYEIIESANRLPDGFTELQYIESTGTHWIDTGLKGNLNTKIEMDFALMRTSNTNIGIYGSGATTQNQSAFCMVTNSTGTYVFPQFDSVSRTTTEAGNLNFVLGQRYHIVHSKDGWYYDNQLGATWATPQSFTTPSNLKLFATDGCSSSGTSAANSYARIYYTKIWDGNTLVRDLVPARRNSDDMLGMYDTVNGQFYTNQGTGTFDAGPEVQ